MSRGKFHGTFLFPSFLLPHSFPFICIVLLQIDLRMLSSSFISRVTVGYGVIGYGRESRRRHTEGYKRLDADFQGGNEPTEYDMVKRGCAPSFWLLCRGTK